MNIDMRWFSDAGRRLLSSPEGGSGQPAPCTGARGSKEAVGRRAGQDHRAASWDSSKSLAVRARRSAEGDVDEHGHRGDPAAKTVRSNPAELNAGGDLAECTVGATSQLHLGPCR